MDGMPSFLNHRSFSIASCNEFMPMMRFSVTDSEDFSKYGKLHSKSSPVSYTDIKSLSSY